MSVNIVTGSHNQLTRIAGLSNIGGSDGNTYVTVEQHQGDIDDINIQINSLTQFVENMSLGDNVVKGYYYQGEFYPTSDHTPGTEIQGDETKLYLDLGAGTFLYYRYNSVTGEYVQEAYYAITGGTIRGWCEIDSNYNLYAPNTIYFVDKNTADAHTSASSLPKIYYDNISRDSGSGDVDDTVGLALRFGSTKLLLSDNYARFNQSINLRTNTDGNISGFGPHIVLNRRAGLYSYDQQNKQYPMIYQNVDNLWIGAAEAQNYHHKGQVYISSGWRDEVGAEDDWVGNETIYIAVPKWNAESQYDSGTAENGPNDASLYEVIHRGNLEDFTINNASFINHLKTALGL